MSTTCRCGATWMGKRIEHCGACHKTFTGTSAGDKHRAGTYAPLTRRCLTTEEMVEAGFRQNKHGHWTFGGVDPRWASDSGRAGLSQNAQQPALVSEGHPDGKRAAE